MIRSLFLFILLLFPLLTIGQEATSTEQNLINSIVNYRDFIFLKDGKAPVLLKSLLEKWSQLGTTIDEQDDFVTAVRSVSFYTSNFSKIKKRLQKRHKDLHTGLVKSLTEEDIEIIKKNKELLDLIIGEGILKLKYPFKLKPSAYIFEEVDFYKIKPNQRIGEIGAGAGMFSLILSLGIKDIELHINELPKWYLDGISERFERASPLVKAKAFYLVNGKKDSSKLEGLNLDKIIVRNTFHHFSKKEEMLNSIKASLKKDGRLFIAEPTTKLTPSKLCKLILEETFIKETIENSGFELVKEQKLGFWLLMEFKPKNK